MTIIVIQSGGTAARISTKGGAIQRLDHNGLPLMRPASDDAPPIDSACYPLVPFGNRVRDNSISFGGKTYDLAPNTLWDRHYVHGEGWRADWQVAEEAAHHVVLTHSHDGNSLPYVYEARQELTVIPGGIDMTLSITNRGETMPFGIGWHPYFPMTPMTMLQTETGDMLAEDEGWLAGEPVPLPMDLDFMAPRGLPDRWVNNGFDRWSGRAVITWPDRGAALRIEADPLFRSMFLFVSDQAFDPGYKRDFFALEPMSHLPGAHGRPGLGGLQVLDKGESLSGSVRLRVV